MAKDTAYALLYRADLDEFRQWIGCADERRFQALMEALTEIDEEDDEELDEDEDAGWDPEELKLAETLLRRVVFEGKLHEGLDDDQRYFLNQLLIDLFDEFVESESLSDDLPLDRLAQATADLRGDAARLVGFLIKGRELNSDTLIWQRGNGQDVRPYLGYLSREEAGALAAALDAKLKQPGPRPSGLLKQLAHAAREAARAEMDLLSFVG